MQPQRPCSKEPTSVTARTCHRKKGASPANFNGNIISGCNFSSVVFVIGEQREKLTKESESEATKEICEIFIQVMTAKKKKTNG